MGGGFAIKGVLEDDLIILLAEFFGPCGQYDGRDEGPGIVAGNKTGGGHRRTGICIYAGKGPGESAVCRALAICVAETGTVFLHAAAVTKQNMFYEMEAFGVDGASHSLNGRGHLVPGIIGLGVNGDLVIGVTKTYPETAAVIICERGQIIVAVGQ